MTELMKLALNKLSASICLVAVLVAGVSYSTYAHHSVSAQYDFDWPFLIDNAVLTRTRWINPHVFLFFDVENEQGEVEEWAVHTTGIRGLRQQGLAKDTLVHGETYTIRGMRAHSGRAEGFLAEIVLPDGTSHILWSGDPLGGT